jgi:excisionase family DNA binding protein
MPFPKHQRFTIKGLAVKWKKHESYIEELLRAEEFPYIIKEGELIGGHPTTRHIYFSRLHWPYGNCRHKELGPHEIATLSEPDAKEDWLRNLSQSPRPWWSPDRGESIYIPRASVEAVEQRYGIQSAAQEKSKQRAVGVRVKAKQTDNSEVQLAENPTYNIEQAAKYIGVSKSTLYRWDHDEYLKPTRTRGGHRRYAKADLDDIKNQP